MLDASEHRKLDEELNTRPTSELIALLDEAYQPETEDFNHALYEKVAPILATRFNYVYKQDMNTVLRDELITVIEKLNELIKLFLAHRHDKEKSYTDKPIW